MCKPATDPDPYDMCTDYECQEHAACVVSVDKKSRSCQCTIGYKATLDGLCVNVDECLTPDICPLETCLDNEGSFSCLNATVLSDYLCDLQPDYCGSLAKGEKNNLT